MGFRSQFEDLVRLQTDFSDRADFYFVYVREAYPAESRWPAPVPDGGVVHDPATIHDRCDLATRFAENVGNQVETLIDNMRNTGVVAYDAYPFRVYAIDTDGQIAATSIKGAAGFNKTIETIRDWLGDQPTP